MCCVRIEDTHVTTGFSDFFVFIHCTNTMLPSFYYCWREIKRTQDEHGHLYYKVEDRQSISKVALRRFPSFNRNSLLSPLVSSVWPRDFVLGSPCL